MEFSPKERAVLAIVQGNIPDNLTPFADIAEKAGCSEEEVLSLLKNLLAQGVIRRFGASLLHQNAGWGFNAMVAWKVRPEEVESCGKIATAQSGISHVYYRPSRIPGWPYEFYTMIHGKSEEECQGVINDLLASWSLRDYAVLKTVRELKKVSPVYFHGNLGEMEDDQV